MMRAALVIFTISTQLTAFGQKKYNLSDSTKWATQFELVDSIFDQIEVTDTSLTHAEVAIAKSIEMADNIFGKRSAQYIKSLTRLFYFHMVTNKPKEGQIVYNQIKKLAAKVLKPWDEDYLEIKGFDAGLKSIDERIKIYTDLSNAAEKYHPDEWPYYAGRLIDAYLEVDDLQRAESIVNKYEEGQPGNHNGSMIIAKSKLFEKKGSIKRAIELLEEFLQSSDVDQADLMSASPGFRQRLESIYEQLARMTLRNSDYAAANLYFQKYLDVFAIGHEQTETLDKQLAWSELYQLCNQQEYYHSLCDAFASKGDTSLIGIIDQLKYYTAYYQMKNDSVVVDSLEKIIEEKSIILINGFPDFIQSPENEFKFWSGTNKLDKARQALEKVLKHTKKKYGPNSFNYLYWYEKQVEIDEAENKIELAIEHSVTAAKLRRKVSDNKLSIAELAWLHKLCHLYWKKDTVRAYQYILQTLKGYEDFGTTIDNYDFKIIAIDAVELSLYLNDSVNFHKYACILMDQWKTKYKENVGKFDESQQEKLLDDEFIGLPALHLKSVMKGFKRWFLNDSMFLSNALKAFTTVYGSSLESELEFKDFLGWFSPSTADSMKVADNYSTLLLIKDSLRFDSSISPSSFNAHYYDGDYINSVLKQMVSNRASQSATLQYHIAARKSQLMNFMGEKNDRSLWYRVPYTKLHWVFYPDDLDSLRLGVFIVKNFDRNIQFIDLCAYHKLDSVLKNYYNNLGDRGIVVGKGPLPVDINRQLYQLIWLPISKQVEGSERIYSFPSGMINSINLNGLQDSTGKFNIDRYELYQLSSVFDFSEYFGEFQPEDMEVVLVGGLNYGELKSNYIRDDNVRKLPPVPFKFLEGTTAEIDSIRSILQPFDVRVHILSGDSGTEANFRRYPTNERYNAILHIASHGFYLPPLKFHESIFDNPDPPLQRTGFVLSGVNQNLDKALSDTANSIVTAEKIYQRKDLERVELVVLSACETALGDIHATQGVFGLARAFRLAGVKRLIVSLWSVPDKETAELMSLFYSNLTKLKNYRSAFMEAQKEMRRRHKDPAKWAGFIFIGQ